MRTLALALVFAATVSGATVGEDPPVTLKLADVPLAQAAEFISALSGVKVAADEAVADRAISIDAEGRPLSQCLTAIAAAAGADVECVREESGGWVFRKKPPRPWREVLAERLAKKVTVRFENVPVADFAAMLSEYCGAGIVIDPAWIASKEGAEGEVTLALEDRAAKDALDLVAVTKGLTVDLRWGVVFLATAERLAALPADLLPPPAADAGKPERDLREMLAAPVSAACEGAPLTDALAFFEALKGVSFGMSEETKAAAAKVEVTLRVDAIALEHALALVLLPRGYRAEVRGGALFVTKP